VGSLVNTLTLHKTSDLRLEAFARLLSEEWDVGVFLDFLNAQAMALSVSGGRSAWGRHSDNPGARALHLLQGPAQGFAQECA
jgi:hypothetical protein